MSLSLLVKQTAPAKDLTKLVRQIQKGGIASLGSEWSNWLEGAMSQLETDDSIEVHRSDELAEILSEMEEALASGIDASKAADRLLAVLAEPTLEERWRTRAENLSVSELHTTLWSDLQRAMVAVETGKFQVVSRWIDLVEQRMISRWESYEQTELLEEEITAETVAGHRLLCDGMESWLGALSELKFGLQNGAVNRRSVLEKAEAGQRLLVILKVIQEEMVNPLQWLVDAWKN